MGVTLALEEERANGAEINDQAIQGVKVGMMGPLAGVGDPVFWFTLRPILGALGASLALSGSIVGPLLFFFAWNIIRMAFIWYTQEFGYKVGTSIAQDLIVVDFSDVAQRCNIYDEYIEKANQTPEDDFTYYGIAIYGTKKLVNKLTGSLPLLR